MIMQQSSRAVQVWKSRFLTVTQGPRSLLPCGSSICLDVSPTGSQLSQHHTWDVLIGLWRREGQRNILRHKSQIQKYPMTLLTFHQWELGHMTVLTYRVEIRKCLADQLSTGRLLLL